MTTGGVMGDSPSIESLRLPASLMGLRLARQRVLAACDDLTHEQRSAAELLVSELVSNAVRHPAEDRSGREAEILVRIHRTARALRVEVHDHDPRPLPPVHPPTTPRETGMGLYLVDELATAWGSHPTPGGDGKVVWFEIRAATPD